MTKNILKSTYQSVVFAIFLICLIKVNSDDANNYSFNVLNQQMDQFKSMDYN